ncbi:MAG TPA: ABC-type transport auxiliary lipoprotein family protein [Candidatus Cybelea sp.]|nr:ABC-type transport auxiliary lipoprotein family protein [Candidatus Cybelea sp.]
MRRTPTQRGIDRRSLFLSLTGLALSGCANLPGLGPAPNVYELAPKTTFNLDLKPVTWQLEVDEPLADGGLDTNRIALKTTPFELKYFADSRWIERAPKMVQTLLVESFENTGRIVGVGRQSVGLRADYTLKSELRQFQAEFIKDSKLPTIRVRLNVKLVKEPRDEIIAFQNFEYTLVSEHDDIQTVVATFNETINKVLRQVVEWTLTTAPPIAVRPGG